AAAGFVSVGVMPLGSGMVRFWVHITVSGTGDSRVILDLGHVSSVQSTSYRNPALFNGHATEAELASLGGVVEPAPAILSTVPASGQTSVAVDAAITVTYDQNVTLVGTPTLTESGSPVAFTASVSGAVLTIAPDADMATDGTFVVTLPAGLVETVLGTPSAAASFSFATVASTLSWASSLVSSDFSDAVWGGGQTLTAGWLALADTQYIRADSLDGLGMPEIGAGDYTVVCDMRDDAPLDTGNGYFTLRQVSGDINSLTTLAFATDGVTSAALAQGAVDMGGYFRVWTHYTSAAAAGRTYLDVGRTTGVQGNSYGRTGIFTGHLTEAEIGNLAGTA
ncbi:Ig-like domain-containing protein, partial [Mangrovicoccus sp. HB161399]|uniref:Ig-like domain-containing protein n=1 Tax=Mangrovicoccus sp. HB161399 TaxID=2720392 RepID=UPI001C12E02E